MAIDLLGIGERAFHARLRQELARWVGEGLVDESTASKLAARYPEGGRGLAGPILLIYVLGAVLIGGGAISLVAYHWDALADTVKLTLVGAAMALCHGVGFWIWEAKRRSGLGHSLVFLGSMIFGANIGLVAQIFQVSSTWYGGFGAWALGCLVACWAYRSGPTAALLVVLATTWSFGFADDHRSWVPFAPFLIAGAVLPLAVSRKSPAQLAVTLLGSGLSYVVSLGIMTGEPAGVGLAVVVTSLLLLSTGGLIPRNGTAGPFASVTVSLGLIAFLPFFYMGSFHRVAGELALNKLHQGPWTWLWAAVPATAVALGLAALCTVRALRGAQPLSLAQIATAAAPVVLLSMIAPPAEVFLALVCNLVLIGIVAQSIRIAVFTSSRRHFWLGTILGGLVIVSRFFEFKTDLWLKGLVMTACGIVVILSGITFERRLQGQGGRHAAS